MGKVEKFDTWHTLAGAAAFPAPDEGSDICGFHSVGVDGRILKMNDTELAWLGYSREEVVGRMAFTTLLAPESVALFHASQARLRYPGWTEELECELLCKDGSRMPILAKIKAVCDAHGRFLACRAIVFDNRKRRQRQAEIDALIQEQACRERAALAAVQATNAYLAQAIAARASS